MLSKTQSYIERTSLSDGIAYISYSLFTALIESILLYFFALFIGWISPRRWEGRKVLAVLSFLVALIIIFAMIGQWLLIVQAPPFSLDQIILKISPDHPVRTGAILLGLFVIGLIAAIFQSIQAIIQNSKFENSINRMIEKLAVLSMFYLIIDIAGTIIILIRNIFP